MKLLIINALTLAGLLVIAVAIATWVASTGIVVDTLDPIVRFVQTLVSS